MSFNRIIDCFLYDGEFDLLCLRLKLHSPHIARFVIVQSSSTFQGDISLVPKLNIDLLQDKFPFCRGKIFFIYLDHATFANCSSAPDREILSRQCFSQGLFDLSSNDLVLVSDVDELFDFTSFKLALKSDNNIFQLNMLFAYFCPNYICLSMPWWGAPLAIPGKLFFKSNLSIGSLRPVGNYKSTIPSHISVRQIYNCGIHMSFLGGYPEVLRKLQRYADNPSLSCINIDDFDRMIKDGQDVFGRDLFWSAVPDLSCFFSRVFYTYLVTLPYDFHHPRLPVAPFFSYYLFLLCRVSSPPLYNIIRFIYLFFYKKYRSFSSRLV